MATYNHHTAREGDRFWVQKRKFFVWNVQNKPRTSGKDLVKMLTDTRKTASLSESCTTTSWKVTLGGKSHYCKKSQTTVCNMGTKILIFGNMSWGLTKQKLNCNDKLYIWGKRRKLWSLRTSSQLWSVGATASCCGAVLLQKGLMHFTK